MANTAENTEIPEGIFITLLYVYESIHINTNTTLRDIEQKLVSLQTQMPVEIRLARHFRKKNFFRETWLASLIANAAVRSGHLTIRDWAMEGNEEMVKHFTSTLLGILVTFMAEVVENEARKKMTIDVHKIIEQIVYDKRGVFEQTDAGEKSYSFLSIDAGENESGGLNAPRPLVLSAGERNEFVEKFLRIKRERIDQVFGLTPQMSLFEQTFDRERALATLIYELYENTNQHGRYDDENKFIKGIRSFNIKRHIGQRRDILGQAESFDELQQYFSGFANGELKFYEISISDNGLGIVKRFLASRPDYQADEDFTALSSLEQLNRIIEKSLSSKLYSGAGKGLRTALSIIGDLGGFLTLRTGDSWVYYDGRTQRDKLELTPVPGSDDIADIRGTYYNILLPVSNPAS